MLNTPDNPGVLTRSLNRIFSSIEAQTLKNITAYMSYVEIHNEVLRDLLSRSAAELDVREDPVRGIVINNALEK